MNEGDELVNIGHINQYLYCPRRYYYINYFDTIEMNFYLKDGQLKHQNQSRRGGWIRELYLKSEKLGIHGKIDVLESKNIKSVGTTLTPIERKRGSSYHDNDEVQLAAYCMLLEDYLDEPVRMGYLYLFGTNERYAITITDWHREKVLQVVQAIRNMTLDNIPEFVDNPNKCEKCSTVQYCLPEETKMLEREDAKKVRRERNE
ncbi:CRISPR-associated protein Cas4 [Methanothrix soehngenii]|jgi:CRISPR-associated exonuclease Cas4|uniref:CRISPR-associated protein Cas4 n=2 Tax=Methanothrix TaxID=2222 RepID=UPI0009CAC125|nr:CRISPR-associated protein Cas4 [Methanothrix soehngenii]MDD2328336.1 CRISPR-associated protein Cas4 [bacterium]MDD4460038.1 CRISPR-associated protein Cas4 [Proteiniphilum sp.]OPY57355.1 MAG: PD-(D/E)XK nuclease superfamily protein [Methanosaeta sp. PtaU1.Bin112]MDD5734740.1 CRISPR-associated protein Cas4 [Methanothrix soehngenii]HOI20585.1 CRISPR-associated protein Cas4 [Methanothrix soehngenii]